MRCSYLLALAPLLLMSGCHKSLPDAAIGTWKDNPHPSSLVGALASAFIPPTSLELKSDNTFLLKLPNLSIEISNNASSVHTDNWVEGTWMVDGSSIKFNTKTVGGKPLAEVEKAILDQQQQAQQQDLQRKQEQVQQEQMQKIQEQQRLQQQQQQQATDQQSTDQQSTAGQPSQPQQPAPAPPPAFNSDSSTSRLSVTPKLVLPHDATLSEDQRKLQLHFTDAVQAPVELERT
jgi:hypothetical protein